MKKPYQIGVRTPAAVLVSVMMLTLISLTPVLANTGSPIHEAVLAYIEKNMPWPQGTVRVDFISVEPDLPSRWKDPALRIEPTGNADFIGDAAFLVRISAGGKFLRTETVRTRIEVLRNVVVAARMIRSGTIIKEPDIQLASKWVRRNMSDGLSSLEEVIGKRITAPVRPGMALSATMLKDAPLVRKGKMVRIQFDNGSVRITTVGIPEEDGTAGSMVRIRNVTSNKVIYARVLGDSLVGVDI